VWNVNCRKIDKLVVSDRSKRRIVIYGKWTDYVNF